MLDHDEPHFMWLPKYIITSFVSLLAYQFCLILISHLNVILVVCYGSTDPRSESSQETKPLLPRIEFRGPMELVFPASREVRLKFPRYVDVGSFRKLILEKVHRQSLLTYSHPHSLTYLFTYVFFFLTHSLCLLIGNTCEHFWFRGGFTSQCSRCG
jgi:hypothetical protein